MTSLSSIFMSTPFFDNTLFHVTLLPSLYCFFDTQQRRDVPHWINREMWFSHCISSCNHVSGMTVFQNSCHIQILYVIFTSLQPFDSEITILKFSTINAAFHWSYILLFVELLLGTWKLLHEKGNQFIDLLIRHR